MSQKSSAPGGLPRHRGTTDASRSRQGGSVRAGVRRDLHEGQGALAATTRPKSSSVSAESLARNHHCCKFNNNAHAKHTLAAISKEERVLVLDDHAPFNFSRFCNFGARRCRGDFLMFLNDDIVPVSETWLEEMLAPSADPRTGVTGPLLIYPDERTQHAGMYLGYNGVAGHTMRFARLPCQDYMFMGPAPRHVSCLTGAALLVRRSIFDGLNGFDEMFATHIQDVDFCLRALGAGYRLVFNPRVVLVYMESVSVRATLDDPITWETRETEHRRFVERWNRLLSDDPYHNPNFDLDDETLSRLRPGKRNAQRPVASHVAQDGA
jgi:GT2 family glycosyltransferase